MRIQSYRPKDRNGLINIIWEQYSEEPKNWEILPSGYVELIFRIDAVMEIDDSKIWLKRTEPTGNFCFLSGLHTKPLYFSFSKFHFIGVQLKPVAVKALFGVPASKLHNSALEGDLIISALNEIEDVLKSERTFKEKAVFLEKFIAKKIDESADFHMAVKLAELIEKMTHRKLLGDKVDLQSHLGYSRTHTYRIFNEWFGNSSHNMLKLYQFVQTLNHIHNSAGTLTDTAMRNGYFDQPHFIRSFKDFAEMTPGTYRKMKSHIPGQFSY